LYGLHPFPVHAKLPGIPIEYGGTEEFASNVFGCLADNPFLEAGTVLEEFVVARIKSIIF
jgi:hypothetical protein